MSLTHRAVHRSKNQSTAPAYSPRGTQLAYGRTGGGAGMEGALARLATNGTLWSIVDLTTSSTSNAKWCLYRPPRPGADPNAPRVEVTSHLALDVWRQPNPFFGQKLFVKAYQQHYELVGEAWWIVVHNALGWPESMWVVRPDRMFPVPSATEGVSGYVYLGPNGENVPLALNEVIRLRNPHPLDPGPAGRGLGAVQTILADLDSSRYSAEWNRNFFLNSAEPGGIIEVPTSLSDPEFSRLQRQWNEEHRGVSAAHRAAILENGAKWVTNATTQRDMQFVELRNVSRDIIREAFRIHPHMLGQSEDVNLANAQAADYTFAQWSSVPRLDVTKDILNSQFLPQFGPSGHGTGQPSVEFDYIDPVPENQEADNAERDSIGRTAHFLAQGGWVPADPNAVLLVEDFPPMKFAGVPSSSPSTTPAEPAPTNVANGINGHAFEPLKVPAPTTPTTPTTPTATAHALNGGR